MKGDEMFLSKVCNNTMDGSKIFQTSRGCGWVGGKGWRAGRICSKIMEGDLNLRNASKLKRSQWLSLEIAVTNHVALNFTW